MEQLINLDGLGDIVNNLTNKLADGVGWIANRETPQKLAVNGYIKEIQESDYDPLTKAAMISNAKQIIKNYCNQNDIVQIAMQSLQNGAKPEGIEDDWLSQFMNKAKHVSSKDFQWIWGKILARECNTPKSIPLTLLYTLERMDKEDAEAFTALRKTSVLIGEEYSPIVIQARFEEYKEFGLTYDNLVNLNALGLIETDFGIGASGYVTRPDKRPDKIRYHHKKCDFPKGNELEVGNVIYTKAGQALCQSIEVEEIEGFWEKYCLPFWEEARS